MPDHADLTRQYRHAAGRLRQLRRPGRATNTLPSQTRAAITRHKATLERVTAALSDGAPLVAGALADEAYWMDNIARGLRDGRHIPPEWRTSLNHARRIIRDQPPVTYVVRLTRTVEEHYEVRLTPREMAEHLGVDVAEVHASPALDLDALGDGLTGLYGLETPGELRESYIEECHIGEITREPQRAPQDPTVLAAQLDDARREAQLAQMSAAVDPARCLNAHLLVISLVLRQAVPEATRIRACLTDLTDLSYYAHPLTAVGTHHGTWVDASDIDDTYTSEVDDCLVDALTVQRVRDELPSLGWTQRPGQPDTWEATLTPLT